MRRLEKSYWYNKAHSCELRDGDRNTQYFHHKATQIKKRNTITRIFDGNGQWRTSKEEMNEVIEHYFAAFLESSNPPDFDEALASIESLVNQEMNSALLTEPMGEEI